MPIAGGSTPCGDYDQYIANADGRADLQNFWRNMKVQEQENIQQLKKLLAAHVQSNCF